MIQDFEGLAKEEQDAMGTAGVTTSSPSAQVTVFKNFTSHNCCHELQAVGCEEMGMLDVPYGQGKRLMLGSVFRYK